MISIIRYGYLITDQSFFIARETIQNSLKVMLHGTIRNDDFYRNTALQYWNNVVTIRNNVATMFQRYVVLKIVVANRLV